jgi:hypothetical protein
MIYLLQRYKRHGERTKQVLGARYNIRNGQYIRKQVWEMEIQGSCFMTGAFPKAMIHPAIWDSRSM